MRKFRDKGIEKLYRQAVRSKKQKAPKARKARRAPKRRRLGPVGQHKAGRVMSEFYHGTLTSHGRRVPRSRPDIGKAIAMSEGRRAERKAPKRRKRRKAKRMPTMADLQVAKKRALAQLKKLKRLDSRVLKSARPKARKAPKRRKSGRKASPAQLVARKRSADAARARARGGSRKHDLKGPSRRR